MCYTKSEIANLLSEGLCVRRGQAPRRERLGGQARRGSLRALRPFIHISNNTNDNNNNNNNTNNTMMINDSITKHANNANQ